jgi:hypothetical protein
MNLFCIWQRNQKALQDERRKVSRAYYRMIRDAKRMAK